MPLGRGHAPPPQKKTLVATAQTEVKARGRDAGGRGAGPVCPGCGRREPGLGTSLPTPGDVTSTRKPAHHPHTLPCSRLSGDGPAGPAAWLGTGPGAATLAPARVGIHSGSAGTAPPCPETSSQWL